MRIGMMEMWKFATQYYEGVQLSTFLESCGFSDIIATCYGGRNRKCAAAFVNAGKVSLSKQFGIGNLDQIMESASKACDLSSFVTKCK